MPIITGDVGEIWSIDLVGKCITSYKGHNYILTAQDNFTKYAVVVPIRSQEAPVVAKAFFDHVILRFGCPYRVQTDQGKSFWCSVQELCRLLKIKKPRTSPFYPQCNSQVE